MGQFFSIDFTVAIVIWTEESSIDRGISSYFLGQLFQGCASIICRGCYDKMFSIEDDFDHSDGLPSSIFDHEFFVGKAGIVDTESKDQG